MRRRLLFSTVVVAVTAVLLLGIPLAVVESRLQISAAYEQVQRDASTVARTLQNRHDSRRSTDFSDVVDAARSLPDRFVSIRYNGHRPQWFGAPFPRGQFIKAEATTKNYTVTIEADESVADSGVTSGLILIGSLAMLAVGVAILLAILMARRLTRPLEELASAADRLGSGDARPLGRRYGVPELDQVAEGLDGSAQRISDLLAAEREFAADASHQLRTPLTALSMRLEEMLAAAGQPEVVGQLLGRTRRSGDAVPTLTSIDDVVAQQVVEWDPAFRRVNRKLELVGEKGLRGYVTAGNLGQVIASLLDNALVHGSGTVTIRTSRTPKSVVIEVRDEGKGVPAELAPRIFERSVSGRPGGTGLGLALARSAAAADGCKVVLVRPRPAVFAVFLPRGLYGADDEAPVVAGPA